MQDILKELMVDYAGPADAPSPDVSQHSTSSLSIALQKSDFGSARQISELMREKKYFELLQKTLKALSEI